MHYLITSYTGGNFSDQKKNHLINFIKQIRKYDNYSHITVIDGVLSEAIASLCDIYTYNSFNDNSPHGQGDLNQLKIGLNILKTLNPNPQYFVKFNYDYYLNDNIFIRIKEWEQMIKDGKHIISSVWKSSENDQGMKQSIAMGAGMFTIIGAEKLFSFNKVNYPIETQLYSSLENNFSKEDYHIYNHMEDFMGDKCYDIFNCGGESLNIDRLNLSA
jgi:hypothetical protein